LAWAAGIFLAAQAILFFPVVLSIPDVGAALSLRGEVDAKATSR
jgi:hypothetical protein